MNYNSKFKLCEIQSFIRLRPNCATIFFSEVSYILDSSLSITFELINGWQNWHAKLIGI